MQEYILTCRHPNYDHVPGGVVGQWTDHNFKADSDESALKLVGGHVKKSECITQNDRKVYCEPQLLIKLTRETIKKW